VGIQLAFATAALREICESEPRATRELGAEIAGALRRRLADLRAIRSLLDLPVGSPRPVTTAAGHRLQIELDGGAHLLLMANHVSNPVHENGSPIWDQITRVQLVAIVRNER
jgi:hypothetical protein